MNQFRELVTAAAALLAVGCAGGPPKRPINVPDQAIFASGNKVGWWQYCKFNEADGYPHCTIWNEGGMVLFDGVFLPLDKQRMSPEELQVVYNDRWADNSQFINLRNGKLLVPASDFDRLSRFAEWIQGK